jgi:hypothetical protein
MTTMTPPARPVRTTRPTLLDEPGIRFGLGEAGLVLVALVAAAVHLPLLAALVLLGLSAVVGGWWVSLGWAAGLGASAWAFYTGFLENRLGELTLAGTDLRRLGVLLLAAVTVSCCHRAVRRG